MIGPGARLESVFARDPDGHVRFKRPALREVAYEGLPFRTRRALHRAIAEGLEQGLGSDVDADPAMLSLHFMLAGQHDPAYMYALLGAERATERFSHADAATLYRRAIEAGRNSKTPGQLAAAWEGLGEALRFTGQPRAATAALTEARRCSEKDPLTQARLFYRHAQVAQRSERLTAAVRWVGRGLRALEGIESPQATAQRARLHSALANIRQRQGRPVQAAELCRLAIAEAERVGELHALAHASYVLDEALFESGQVRPGDAPNSVRALEIYARLGDPEQEHKVLNNMGGLAYFAGNWETAAELYRRAADRSERAGKPADTAYSDCNIAEILSDQGHLSEAEAHLKRARRVWSSTGDRQGVGYANILLGRLAVRDGRHEEGLALLQSAEQELRRLRVDADAELAAVLGAEAEALSGDPRRALKLADALLTEADRSQALLHRARGMALARLGRSAEARVALESAIAAAREHSSEYELALAADLLGRLKPLEPELARERDSILTRLKIEWLPQPQLATDEAGAVALAG